MPQKYFHYKNNRLFCENLAMDVIAKDIGSPVYVYSRNAFLDHYTQIADAFSQIAPLICYSVKANSNLSVLRTLVEAGSGMDIVSGGELYRVLQAGVDPQKVVFSGVGKTESEILYAIHSGILMFNIESEPELIRIAKIARDRQKTVRAALRVNPNVDPKTHQYITTGKKENKFGIDMRTAERLYETFKDDATVRLTGVHAHIGSQITTVDPFLEAVRRVAAFISILRDKGILIETLNVGGGLGIVYRDEKPQSAAEYAAAMIPEVQKTKTRLLMEPGRFIAGNAGAFMARVEYVKKTEDHQFVIVDGAMNDLLRPSLYDAYHEIVPIIKRKESFVADIVGPVCESGDFFGKQREIPVVKEGDLVACLSAGAYGFTMASNYNTRPRVAEVMVDGEDYRVIRRRETVEELVAGEL